MSAQLSEQATSGIMGARLLRASTKMIHAQA